MAEPSLASNNPFRRHATAASHTSKTSSVASASALASSTPPPSQPALPLSFAAEAPANFVTTSSPAADPHPLDSAAQHGHPHPTGDEFREQLRALPKSSEAPPSTTFLKPKPVKKVRVQSPPPSSPDSVDADFEFRFPASGPGDDTVPTGTLKTANTIDGYFAGGPRYNDGDDSSSGSDSEDSDNDTTKAQDSLDDFRPSPITRDVNLSATFPISASHTVPANPFQRTLGDLEAETRTEPEGDAEPSQALPHHASVPIPLGKGSLDVDAFKRLLLTGQAGVGVAVGAAARLQHDGGSITDASSVSRQSLFDAAHPLQDVTPRSSHEISETDDDRSGLIQASQSLDRHILRKKPPPPSSRHGKLIKSHPDRGQEEAGATSGLAITIASESTGSPSDTNKPLPPPPARRSMDEEADSIFDREAAGKVPESDDFDVSDDAVPPPRPPTPPDALHSTESAVDTTATTPSPSQPKKPTPPPRRHGHIRSDSRSSVQERQYLQTPPSSHRKSEQTRQHEQSPTGSPRSSYESARSRSSSLKLAINSAPAPPPPRRTNHVSRPSTSFVSPSSMSFTSMPSSASSPSAVSEQERSPPGLSGVPTAAAAAAAVYVQPSTSIPGDNNAGATVPPSLQRIVSSTSASAMTPSLSSGGSGPGATKLGKPPPPPTRNPSVRNKEGRHVVGNHRPPSVSSVDAVSRRVAPQSHPHGAQPPPPPPRARGSSRGSMDGPSGPMSGSSGGTAPLTQQRKTSTDGSRRMVSGGSLANVDEGELPSGTRAAAAPSDDDINSAANILAGLNALQREVDALRGQYGKPGST